MQAWAAQVCSFLHFISPIVDGVPQHIDTSIVSAHLQRRTFDAVNGSDLRKVREWLGVRGPVNGDNYQLAGYLQAVASKTGRRRLAQFRMGSHMLGVETGRWQRLPRAERLCQRCSCGVVDDEGRKEYLHICPDKASWLMQGPQRERRAHTGNETGTKLKSKHKTKQNRKCKFTKRNDADAGQHKSKITSMERGKRLIKYMCHSTRG